MQRTTAGAADSTLDTSGRISSCCKGRGYCTRGEPLIVIKGYVYTLHRAEYDPAKAAKLDVIDGECERLGYLIEDLLELSRAARASSPSRAACARSAGTGLCRRAMMSIRWQTGLIHSS
jgi:hypothetical protein